MDKIVVTLSLKSECRFEISGYPRLSSGNKLVSKGIGILERYAPGILRYLSKQRMLAHLSAYRIEINGAGEISESEIRYRLGRWMRQKRNRRLAYVTLELLLMPPTAFMAILPGPNVLFYGVFVLFYFHFKTFLNLSKIKNTELDISLGEK